MSEYTTKASVNLNVNGKDALNRQEWVARENLNNSNANASSYVSILLSKQAI